MDPVASLGTVFTVFAALFSEASRTTIGSMCEVCVVLSCVRLERGGSRITRKRSQTLSSGQKIMTGVEVPLLWLI